MTLSAHKKKKNLTKPFAAVELVTINTISWGCLNKTEAWIYIILKTFYKGDNQKFKAPFEIIKNRSRVKHSLTIIKAIEGLENKNWIRVTRYGKHGRGRGLRIKPNEYELTFRCDVRRW